MSAITAELALPQIDVAEVVRVEPQLVRALETPVGVENLAWICETGLRATPPSAATLVDLSKRPVDRSPLTLPVKISPQPRLHSFLAWRDSQEELAVIAFVQSDGEVLPTPWGAIVWNSEARKGRPFYVRPGSIVYGPPEVGMLLTAIHPASDSLCGWTFRGLMTISHSAAATLDAMENTWELRADSDGVLKASPANGT